MKYKEMFNKLPIFKNRVDKNYHKFRLQEAILEQDILTAYYQAVCFLAKRSLLVSRKMGYIKDIRIVELYWNTGEKYLYKRAYELFLTGDHRKMIQILTILMMREQNDNN